MIQSIELKTEPLWIRCQPCTALLNFPLHCLKCKQEFRVNVVQLKMLRSKEPKE